MDVTALRDEYLQAQLEGDRARALHVVSQALSQGLSVARVHLEIVQTAQYEIGRLWETNVIGVSMEHQATAISQLVMAALYEQLPRRESNGKRVLVACVQGELHDMGARIAADFLEMDGFDVRFLGADVPHESLAERVEAVGPDLVALSATMSFHLLALERAVAAIRRTSRGGVPILVGGRAFADPEARSRLQLDVQGFGASAEELVQEARRVTARAA